MLRFQQYSLAIFISILIHFEATAQEQLGLRLDNYSGANAITLNPAANATYPLAWDINLVGMGATFQNNLGYIEKASVRKFLSNANGIGPDPALNIAFKGTPTLEYNFKNKNQFYGSANARIMGPSFVVNLASGHTFGLFTGLRFLSSSHSIPKVASPYEMNKIARGTTFEIDPFKGSGMVWSEVGMNYAYKMGDDTEGGLAIGANIKYVQAYQGFFARNYKGTKLSRISDDTIQVSAMRGSMGFTNNYNSDNVDRPNGSGFGFDIGAVMTLPSNDERPYAWRLGASLMDLGKVNMTQNVEYHEVELKEAVRLNTQDFENLDANDPLGDVVRRVNQKSFNTPAKTLTGTAMTIALPSALSLQGDYSFTKNVFVNALLVQRLPASNVALERDNLLAVTPRYESRWLGASMPISLFNYQQLRIGLAARLGFLTIGTDHLLSFMTNSNLYGTDFYMALKINPFKIGLLSGGGSSGGNGNWGSKKRVSCYRF